MSVWFRKRSGVIERVKRQESAKSAKIMRQAKKILEDNKDLLDDALNNKQQTKEVQSGQTTTSPGENACGDTDS